MNKKLSEMTLDELWQLFPVFLTEHKPYWSDWYGEEEAHLKKILPSAVGFYHIGSTAVEGIWAKPIIDILAVFSTYGEMLSAAKTLQGSGYIEMSRSQNRISFNKGYTESGFAERVFHLHLRLCGDDGEVYFAKYLNARPEVAKEYESLKLRLWKEYEHDRDGYTRAKTAFVQKYTALAKQT